MFLLDSCKLSKSLPLLLALLLVAQIDLASAFAWPLPLLTLLHLRPETDEFDNRTSSYKNRSRSELLGSGHCSSLPQMRWRQRATNR